MGNYLTSRQKKRIRDRLRAGKSLAAIARAVGCSVPTVRHYRIDSDKRPLSEKAIGFLSDVHLAEIGEAEADRLLAERIHQVRCIGFFEPNGRWHPPIFPPYTCPPKGQNCALLK